jgi:hypothetical protein
MNINRDFHYVRSLGEYKFPLSTIIAAALRATYTLLGMGREYNGNDERKVSFIYIYTYIYMYVYIYIFTCIIIRFWGWEGSIMVYFSTLSTYIYIYIYRPIHF